MTDTFNVVYKEAYNDLDIRFSVNHDRFRILNIAHEVITRSFPKHSHGNRSYEMHYIASGHGSVTIEGQAYKITPNTLYITGPHIEHEQSPDPADPMEEYSIYFQLLEKGSVRTHGSPDLSLRFLSTCFWFGQDSQELWALLKKLFAELRKHQIGYMIQVEAIALQIFVNLVRNFEKSGLSTERFPKSNLSDAKSLIIEESFLYNCEELTLEKLSEKLALGIRQTERLLKEYYGKTFQQKKTEAKMSMAAVLLADDSLTIGEIAARLNYSSIQHFSYAFKKYYGISPTQYQKAR